MSSKSISKSPASISPKSSTSKSISSIISSSASGTIGSSGSSTGVSSEAVTSGSFTDVSSLGVGASSLFSSIGVGSTISGTTNVPSLISRIKSLERSAYACLYEDAAFGPLAAFNAFSALRAYSNSGKRFGYSSGSARDSAALTLTLLRSSLHNLTISLTLLKFD